MALTDTFNAGRARRGGSGALSSPLEDDLQPAIAGWNSHVRLVKRESFRPGRAMKAGLCATNTDEPRQDRKVAAVSHAVRVPQINLAGVRKGKGRPSMLVEQGCTALFFKECNGLSSIGSQMATATI